MESDEESDFSGCESYDSSYSCAFAKGLSKGKFISGELESLLETLFGWEPDPLDAFKSGSGCLSGFAKGKAKGKQKLYEVVRGEFFKGLSKGKEKGFAMGREEGCAKGFAVGKGKGIAKGKAIVDNEHFESTASGCAYFRDCLAYVRSLPSEVQQCFDVGEHTICFCDVCHHQREDRPWYNRGGRIYALPVGWARIALKSGGAQAGALGAFDWHVAFHGTSQDALPAILGTGHLARPGERLAALSGGSVPIRPGHITAPHYRWNNYLWDWEWFDPYQIFCSPSIRYCELPVYAKPAFFTTPSYQTFQVKVALQLRLRPGSYCIGHSTVEGCGDIDPYISNDEIEWYTDGTEHAAHVITGLMVKLEPCYSSESEGSYSEPDDDVSTRYKRRRLH